MDGRPASAPQMAAEVEAFLSQRARPGSAEGHPNGASGPVAGHPTRASGPPIRPADAPQRAIVCAGGRPAATWKAVPSFLPLVATGPPATPFWDSRQRVSTCAVSRSALRQRPHGLPHQRVPTCVMGCHPRGSQAGGRPRSPRQGSSSLGWSVRVDPTRTWLTCASPSACPSPRSSRT
eukprot:2929169-Alexandrium_andersonii.AAC.1